MEDRITITNLFDNFADNILTIKNDNAGVITLIVTPTMEGHLLEILSNLSAESVNDVLMGLKERRIIIESTSNERH